MTGLRGQRSGGIAPLWFWATTGNAFCFGNCSKAANISIADSIDSAAAAFVYCAVRFEMYLFLLGARSAVLSWNVQERSFHA
jgi:hypothetical protein